MCFANIVDVRDVTINTVNLIQISVFSDTDSAGPVDQIVELRHHIVRLAAGRCCWLGCSHSCAFLSDWHNTANTETEEPFNMCLMVTRCVLRQSPG